MQEFSLFSSAAASVNWYVKILFVTSKHSASISQHLIFHIHTVGVMLVVHISATIGVPDLHKAFPTT